MSPYYMDKDISYYRYKARKYKNKLKNLRQWTGGGGKHIMHGSYTGSFPGLRDTEEERRQRADAIRKAMAKQVEKEKEAAAKAAKAAKK